jgi:hypothetical protein
VDLGPGLRVAFEDRAPEQLVALLLVVGHCRLPSSACFKEILGVHL